MKVILDKSYLDGEKTENVLKLCNNHTAIMIDSLFYELLTTDKKSRARCFSKIPKKKNPLLLIPNAGQYYRHEMENKRPFERIELLKEDIDFNFNEGLHDEKFEVSPEVKELINKDEIDTEKSTAGFVGRARVVREFFGNNETTESLITRIATEESLVRKIYDKIIPDEDEYFIDRISPDQLNSRWVMFRWIQTQVIYGLIFNERYQGKIPDDLTRKSWIKAEHDMLDSDYVLFGAMTGAIATRDNKIKEIFIQLCPNGHIF